MRPQFDNQESDSCDKLDLRKEPDPGIVSDEVKESMQISVLIDILSAVVLDHLL